jgi:hypothetical protein
VLLDIAGDCAGVEAVGLGAVELGLGKICLPKSFKLARKSLHVIIFISAAWLYIVKEKKFFFRRLIVREYL